MGYLDYSGLSHFLDKIKAMVFGGATSSAAGSNGLVPAPGVGKNVAYLKGSSTMEKNRAGPLGSTRSGASGLSTG